MSTKTHRAFFIMLAYASILALTAALIFCTVRIHQISVAIDKRAYDTSWALIQLQHEMGRFLSTLELYSLNRTHKKELELRYDILWSRLPVLMSGKLKDSIDQQYQVARLVTRIYERVVALEQQVLTLKPNSPAYEHILISLSPLLEPLSKSIASTFQGKALKKTSLDIRLSGLRHALIAVISGLLTATGFLLYLTYLDRRESFINYHLDKLTGLKNRFALIKCMEKLSKNQKHFSLIMLDLQDFSLINHRFGAHIGDTVLNEISNRLKQNFDTPTASIGRIGGDAFAVVKEGVVKISEIIEDAKELKRLLEKQILIEKQAIHAEVAIGIAYYPSDAKEPIDLIHRAESAVHLCKQNNQSYAIFDRSFLKEMHRKKQVATDLNHAIDAQIIEPYYQPIIDLDTGVCSSVEALVRWRHHELGFIPPNELIDIAETYELSSKLGAWILKTICQQTVQWHAMGFKHLQVAFNVSPRMYQRNLLKTVNQVLVETGLPSHSLILEITEDTSIQQINTSMHLMVELYRQGIELALDDFGMGYSSLSYLQTLPISRLKLDRSFIKNTTDMHTSRAFYHHIMKLAQSLNKKIVCEGIETVTQLEMIQAANCPAYGQGYLFSRPLPANEMSDALATNKNWLAHINKTRNSSIENSST